jgi:hypothetical protein
LERAICNEIKTDFDCREMETLYGFEIPKDETDKILVQFSALGLIRQRGSIWELSAKGVVYVSRLLAIRKGRSDADSSRWCTIEWVTSDCEKVAESNDIEEW